MDALKSAWISICINVVLIGGILLLWGLPLLPSPIRVYAKEGAMQTDSVYSAFKMDMVLVLDNSGSMMKNDPRFLTRDVVTNFLAGFGETSRIAMIVFDQQVRLVVPLSDVSGMVARANFLKGLEQVNYKGQLSDSPSAMERAIYELKVNGREGAYKIIVLLTDGIVETGDKARDIIKTQWLREDLTQESKNEAIRIFAVAFTDQADYSLIQTLALKTGGEYFRAYTAVDIQDIFNKIKLLISPAPTTPNITASGSEMPTSAPAAQTVSLPDKTVPAASTVTAPKQPPAVSTVASGSSAAKIEVSAPKSDFIQLFLLIGVFVLLAVIVTILALNRRNHTATVRAGGRIGRKSGPETPMPKAELIDVVNITNQKTFELSKPLTKIGRDLNNDVAIVQETVSSLHATIEYLDGFFYLEDQRSKNKTFLNDEEILPHAPRKLKSGDIILINIYKFIFILPDLIPVGETILDLSGKTVVRSELPRVQEPVSASKAATAIPKAMLIDVANVTGKKTVLFDKSIIKVGRGVPNDISIAQTSISGSHAVIEFRNDAFFLEDLRSKNKTRLNGQEIPPNTPKKLKSGDEILFDIYKFIFLLERQTPSGDTDENW